MEFHFSIVLEIVNSLQWSKFSLTIYLSSAVKSDAVVPRLADKPNMLPR